MEQLSNDDVGEPIIIATGRPVGYKNRCGTNDSYYHKIYNTFTR